MFNSLVTNEPVEVNILYKDRFAIRLGIVNWRLYNNASPASGGGLEVMGRMVTFRIFNSAKIRNFL